MLPRTTKIKVHQSVTEVPHTDWNRLFPGQAEGWEYFRACELAAPDGFELGALTAWQDDRLVAASPKFSVNYRLDMSLPPRLRALGNWFNDHIPSLVNARVVGLGSPLTEECPLGIDTRLPEADRPAVMEAILDGLLTHGRSIRASVLAIKDLPHADHLACHSILQRAGYAGVPTLPVATLHLPYAGEAEYIASLKGPMRNELRRKLRALDKVRFSFPESIDGYEQDMVDLFEETKSRRKADYDDFDEVPSGYFRKVLDGLGPRARLMLAHVGDQLVSFNIFLVEDDRVIGKYLGMRYPIAREHNLYFLNWMMVVRWCLANGKQWLQSGHTGYRVKVRLGSQLKRSWVYFRHVNPVINVGFRTIGPRFAFDAMDPDLRELGEAAPYLDGPGGSPHHSWL